MLFENKRTIHFSLIVNRMVNRSSIIAFPISVCVYHPIFTDGMDQSAAISTKSVIAIMNTGIQFHQSFDRMHKFVWLAFTFTILQNCAQLYKCTLLLRLTCCSFLISMNLAVLELETLDQPDPLSFYPKTTLQLCAGEVLMTQA